MDGNGDNQTAADLIGCCKKKTSYQTGDGDSMTDGVAEYKDHGAENKGNNYSPSSQEAVKYSPKEDLLSNRTYYAADNEKEEKIHSLSR